MAKYFTKPFCSRMMAQLSQVIFIVSFLSFLLAMPIMHEDPCPDAPMGHIAFGVQTGTLTVRVGVKDLFKETLELRRSLEHIKRIAEKQELELSLEEAELFFKRALDAEEELLSRLRQEVVLKDTTIRRVPREIFTVIVTGVVSIGIGLILGGTVFSVSAEEDLKNMDREENQFRSALEKTLNQMEEKMALAQEQTFAMLEARTMVQDFVNACQLTANKYTSLLDTITRAHDRRLHPGVFTHATMERLREEFTDALAKNTSMKLVHPLDLLTTDVSMAQSQHNGRSLDFTFYIPIMPKAFPSMCLKNYQVRPQLYENNGVIVEIKSPFDYIATDKSGDYHKSLTQADLAACRREGNYRYCTDTIISTGPVGCMAAIQFNNVEEAAKKCDLVIHHESPVVKQVSQTSYAVYALEEVDITRYCNQTNQNYMVKGYQLINMTAGCTLTVGDKLVAATEESSEFVKGNFSHELTEKLLGMTGTHLDDVSDSVKGFHKDRMEFTSHVLPRSQLHFGDRSLEDWLTFGAVIIVYCAVFAVLLDGLKGCRRGNQRPNPTAPPAPPGYQMVEIRR